MAAVIIQRRFISEYISPLFLQSNNRQFPLRKPVENFTTSGSLHESSSISEKERDIHKLWEEIPLNADLLRDSGITESETELPFWAISTRNIPVILLCLLH